MFSVFLVFFKVDWVVNEEEVVVCLSACLLFIFCFLFSVIVCSFSGADPCVFGQFQLVAGIMFLRTHSFTHLALVFQIG